MNSRANKIKFELFIMRKTLKSGRFFAYLYNRYFLANRIYKNNNLKNAIKNKTIRDDLSLHVLAGNSVITMFIWSLASFYLNSRVLGMLYVHDDGTLTHKDKKVIKDFFPNSVIISSNDVYDKENSDLHKYPVIEEFRKNNPNFIHGRKFIDAYFLSSKKFHLVIDCDILWFADPKEISDQVINDGLKSHMTKDVKDFPVHFKDGTTFGDGINSGIDYYRKENLSMDKFTEFLLKVDMEHKSSHFIEQVGFAYCLKNLELLDYERYSTKGGMKAETVSMHYVGPRRESFFLHGIKLIKEKILNQKMTNEAE